MNIIGCDNGSTGTLAVIRDGVCLHFGPTPTKDALHYGKKGKLTKRLDRAAFRSGIEPLVDGGISRAYVERPFTGGPMMINAMLSARGFFEATLCALEDMGIGYEVVDSGEWQKAMLGAVKGSAELKKASMLRGIQIYPEWADAIKKHGDADALLIAHHYARK
jgi:hypothetical protein